MRGYFLEGSKSGGLMIQPSILRLSKEESYQSSSTAPSFLAVKSSRLREVRTLSLGLASEAPATSPGSEGGLYWMAKQPFLAMLKLPSELRCSARTLGEPSREIGRASCRE